MAFAAINLALWLLTAGIKHLSFLHLVNFWPRVIAYTFFDCVLYHSAKKKEKCLLPKNTFNFAANPTKVIGHR